MFAPVTLYRWRGRILYVLSSLIGMSSISSSECPLSPHRNVLYLLIGMSDKEEDGEAVLRPLALPSLRSPLFPCL